MHVQGPDLETPDRDYLSTTPERLSITVDTVLETYEAQQGQNTNLGKAADLMHPEVILKLRDLKEQLRRWDAMA